MRLKNKSFFKNNFTEQLENKFYLFAEGDEGGEGAGGGAGDDADGADAVAAAAAADKAADAAGADKAAKKTDSLLNAADKKTDIKTKADEVVLLAGKFKTAQEMEQGYKELTKKLVESGKIAPDKYELELPDGLALADPENDPMLKSFNDVAKKHNLSNEAYNELIALKLASDAEAMPNYEAELEKLGDKGLETLKSLSNFLSANLSKEEYAVAERLCATADGIKVMDKLRSLSVNSKVPGVIGNEGTGKITAEAAEEKLRKANEALAANRPEGPRLRKEAEQAFKELYPE